MTPLAMLRSVSAVATGGRLYVPHLLKEVRPVPATPHFPAREARTFDRPDPKLIPLHADRQRLVVEGAWAVVNTPGATGYGAHIEGFDLAGKTGTAQVAQIGRDVGENKDHAWFVSFAPAYRPEIAVVALVENAGFGGTHAAPAARGVYEVFYRKTRHAEPPGQLARAAKP
jgi:penicillin-binding protein 2